MLDYELRKKPEKIMNTEDIERLSRYFGELPNNINDRDFKVEVLHEDYDQVLRVKEALEIKFGIKIPWCKLNRIFDVVFKDMKKTKAKGKKYAEGKEAFALRRAGRSKKELKGL